MGCILQIRFLPLDGSQVSRHMLKTMKIIRDSGLKYDFGRMAGEVEGSWEELKALIDLCFRHYKDGCPHFMIDMSVSYRESRKKLRVNQDV